MLAASREQFLQSFPQICRVWPFQGAVCRWWGKFCTQFLPKCQSHNQTWREAHLGCDSITNLLGAYFIFGPAPAMHFHLQCVNGKFNQVKVFKLGSTHSLSENVVSWCNLRGSQFVAFNGEFWVYLLNMTQMVWDLVKGRIQCERKISLIICWAWLVNVAHIDSRETNLRDSTLWWRPSIEGSRRFIDLTLNHEPYMQHGSRSLIVWQLIADWFMKANSHYRHDWMATSYRRFALHQRRM